MANIFEINRVSNKITLGTTDTTINIASHTASRLLALDASKNLEVVTIGASLDYTRPTLNTIQDIRTSASPYFTGIELGHATDTTITRVSAGVIAVEGTTVMLAGDAPTAHSIASHSDTTGTGAELNELTDGSTTTLHAHTGVGTDEKVGVDSAATAGYIGAANSDGVLRTGSSLSYTDGGDFVTINAIQDIRTSGSPQFTGIELGHATDTTLTRVSAGVVAIEGTNIAMSGGAFHDGFSDSVANEHIDHTGVTLTAGSGLAGGGTIAANRTFDLDINSLTVATIAAGDFVPFWDITATATNKKITFANFESTLSHNNLANTHNLTTDISHDGISDVSIDDHHARTHDNTYHSTDYQPLDAELTSLAALSYAATSFVKMTGANTFALRTIGETQSDLGIDLNTTHRGSNGSDHSYLDQVVTIASTPTFAGLTSNGKIDISVTGDGAEVLRLSTERPWRFLQQSSGSAAELTLSPTVDAKKFNIKSADLTKIYFSVYTLNNGAGYVTIPGGNFAIGTTPKTKLTIEGTLTLKEQATADGSTAAYGQLWVKTATPNQLWFTDDGGNDIQLGLSHLSFGALVDPDADRVMFWDDSESALKWLTVMQGIQINGTKLQFDINSLTEVTTFDGAADYVVIFDSSEANPGYEHKKILINNLLGI